MLGNSVWASSLVLAGFMGGLGLGNLLIARWSDRITRVVRTYAIMELVIAVTGFALVMVLPQLTDVFAPIYRTLAKHPVLLNLARLIGAFFLTLVPSTAMGATLPLLVAALLRESRDFGGVLGRLYGMNTLGAVVGAVLGEVVLIEALGIRGTALVAGSLNIIAAMLVMTLRELDDLPSRDFHPAQPKLSKKAKLLLIAAGTCGATLLALETVWFRVLSLFAYGSSQTFALMLSVVLAGIGTGALVGGRLSAKSNVAKFLPTIAIAAALTTLIGYLGMVPVAAKFPHAFEWHEIMPGAMVLMFGTSFLSGILFTLIASAFEAERRGNAIQNVGILVFANTVGAMAGPGLASFVLLPFFGMERSIQISAVAYLAVAGLMFGAFGMAQKRLAGGLIIGVALTLFASVGLMEKELKTLRFSRYESELLAWVESPNATLAYMGRLKFGQTIDYRLVTNAHSMSGTLWAGRRYMKLYVYLPVAMHPHIKNALLISYGVGVTAKALTDTPEVQTIDVVDISADTLALSDIVYPNPKDHPLKDPRVSVHVEDGRYFLKTTEKTFDLITGEPPPPKNAGIVNLYTREYFQLARDRLNPGGFLTYWLPVRELHESDTKAIILGFCEVFDDCTLWNGYGLDWMLVGRKKGGELVSDSRFRAQWNPPRDEIIDLGYEHPEQLAAMFMMGAEQLKKISANTLPLVDNFPARLAPDTPPREAYLKYTEWLDWTRSRDEFASSKTVAAWVPEKIRSNMADYFEWQDLIARSEFTPASMKSRLEGTERLLRNTTLNVAPLSLLGTNSDIVRAAVNAKAKGNQDPEIRRILGLQALANRDYDSAVVAFKNDDELRVFAQCMRANSGPCNN